MTDAYHIALMKCAAMISPFNMSEEQTRQAIQFRALDIEIDRAEMDLAIRETAGDWPSYEITGNVITNYCPGCQFPALECICGTD